MSGAAANENSLSNPAGLERLLTNSGFRPIARTGFYGCPA